MQLEVIQSLQKFALNLRKKILKMAFEAGSSSSHLGGALSIVEIISILFSQKMNFDKNNLNSDNRDKFILSKGHACLAYYAALSEIGLISDHELKSFEKDDSNLLGHPILNKKIGIDFSTGSLGMGLSIAIGLSIAAKKKKKKKQSFCDSWRWRK